MPPFLRRTIITAGVCLALAIVMYFSFKSAGPIMKLVVVFGGFGAMFIMVKSYLFRS